MQQQEKPIRKLKDDYVFLLNDVESNLHDKLTEKDMEKRKYEEYVIECKLLSTSFNRNT